VKYGKMAMDIKIDYAVKTDPGVSRQRRREVSSRNQPTVAALESLPG
jgi:hypothetical protein